MHSVLASILRVSTVLKLSSASFCDKDANGSFPVPSGHQNLYPINDYATSAELVATVPNGKLVNVTVPMDGGDTRSHFHLVHLYGNASQRGAALGALLKTHLHGARVIDQIWAHFKSQITSALPGWLPHWLTSLIAEVGLDAALGLTYELTKKYTSSEYFDEIKAAADAMGISFVKLRDIHMIAGLTQGKCSMFGAWGDALAGGDGMLQLRALDWDMDAAIVDHPMVFVMHTPTSTYVMVGITGFLGALTGVSDKQLAISEIGVSLPDKSFGKESRVGVPFVFLLRDILHSDVSLDDSIHRITSASRTCDLILGVGDGKTGAGGGKGFRAFQYSSSVATVIDDTHLIPVADWHAPIPDVVYFGMDWLCPGDNMALQRQLRKHRGNLTAEIAIRDVTAVEQSGDTHLAYYDLRRMTMWVSFARQSYLSGPPNGYDRQFTRFDLKSLFAEPPPATLEFI